MATILEQIPVRLQCVAISNPPAEPVDNNTGIAPAFWRGSGLSVAIGIFDTDNVGIDLSNLTYLQVLIQQDATSLVQLAMVQIDAADITPVIDIGDWRNGSAQNALAVFTAADLDMGLDATDQKEFWMVLRGMTANGAPIVYAAGAINGYNPGIPPTPAASIVSRHAQTAPLAGDMTVTPSSQLHKEVITVGGTARTFNVLLGNNGIVDGAELTLLVTLPATADIILNVKNGLSSNPTISTISTGVVLGALLKYYYDADAAAWVPMFYLLPPT